MDKSCTQPPGKYVVARDRGARILRFEDDPAAWILLEQSHKLCFLRTSLLDCFIVPHTTLLLMMRRLSGAPCLYNTVAVSQEVFKRYSCQLLLCVKMHAAARNCTSIIRNSLRVLRVCEMSAFYTPWVGSEYFGWLAGRSPIIEVIDLGIIYFINIRHKKNITLL